MASYLPSQKILEKYANVLVNFALHKGKGIKEGEVIRLSSPESAKPLYLEVRKAILKAGGHIISNYYPDDEQRRNPSRDFFELASDKQLQFFPKKFAKGLADQIDHTISLISEVNKHALEGINPKKIMTVAKAQKPLRDWLDKKENQDKFSWTLALFGTKEMAQEAKISLEAYWQQIIEGCYLNTNDPIKTWQQTFKQIEIIAKKLDALPIEKLHIEAKDTDLWISLGEKRRWLHGSGNNIPSFEIFTSPDWRGTEGNITFNQPLYVYGTLIKDVQLEFNKGKVTKFSASQNQNVLEAMIKTKNADKVGEFSLTDKRFSKITKFMAETLFDENMGGPYGNMHIAVGRSFADSFQGNPSLLKKSEWRALGFNQSTIHTDIISTTDRTVTAILKNGKEKIIYQKGQFTL